MEADGLQPPSGPVCRNDTVVTKTTCIEGRKIRAGQDGAPDTRVLHRAGGVSGAVLVTTYAGTTWKDPWRAVVSVADRVRRIAGRHPGASSRHASEMRPFVQPKRKIT